MRNTLVRVANGDHGFAPADRTRPIVPSLDQIDAIKAKWFGETLGLS